MSHSLHHQKLKDSMDFFSSLIYPFEWLVSWIIYGWHALFTAIGLDAGLGLAPGRSRSSASWSSCGRR